MIPKIIHYCWFGGKDIPKKDSAVMDEWAKMHPDFRIKIWNESNSPIDISYMKNAAALSNWANMSNYVRLHALHEYGGIYMDTDFQYVKNLDPLLSEKCFAGIENQGSLFYVNNAFFGAEKKHPFIRELLDEIIKFFSGSELANLSSPHLITNLLREKGLLENKYQKIADVTLFPYDYFYPLPYDMKKDVVNIEKYMTKNSYAVHLWHGTWEVEEEGNDIYEHSKEELLAIEKSAVWKGQSQNFVNQKHIEVLEQRELSLNIKLNDLNDYIETQEKEITQNKEFAIRIEKEKLFLNTLIIEQKDELKQLGFSIDSLKQIEDELSNQLNWYRTTYEERSLLGIIKTKIFKK